MSARDVLVTGMGFCLPGRGGPVRTAADLWSVAARGQSCLDPADQAAGAPALAGSALPGPALAGRGHWEPSADSAVTGGPAAGDPAAAGGYPRHGRVRLAAGEFAARLPDVPGFYARQFTAAHRFGLLALDEACADAGLDYRAGQLSRAAILTGRGGIDTMVAPYAAAAGADLAAVTAGQAAGHVAAMLLAASPSDVNLAQAALARATGPCFTVVSGCVSSAVQLGNAARMIAAGVVELAVVTGVDALDAVVVNKSQRMTGALRDDEDGAGPAGIPPLPAGPMRPYDPRGGPVAYGEGAATLILESRGHAARRGARCYGRLLAHALARDGLPHPVALDEDGAGLVRAMRQCLGDRWPAGRVPYVHGASDGQAAVTAAECQAIRAVYGSAGLRPLVTSQEACFGHNGAPAGCLGVALTLLMLARGEVCPTAGCQVPAPGLPFDPVPGTATRPLVFDYALNITLQAGGTASVILLGTPDAQ
jgi:3-oxoacyl-[acyl-carrier-protein] synthase II